MFSSLCILGRQPALGLTELESLFGASALQPVGTAAVLLDKTPADVPFAYLGGTIKFCKVLTLIDSINWKDIQKFLAEAVPQHAKMLPEGKLRLGLSVYGLKVEPRQITGTGLELKKMLKKENRPVRIVPNNELALNSAQVLHNQLTDKLGWELIFVKNGNRTIVAQTIAVQDIEAYTKRDRLRPGRDARVGMLPPKLAQIITNMATAAAQPPVCGPEQTNEKTILDPFCGTGVVLLEAALMGYNVYGTDLEPRLVDLSKVNLAWLEKQNNIEIGSDLEVGDATTYSWQTEFDTVASELYLGRPFTSPPANDILQKTINEVNTITKKFLHNLAKQTKAGFRLCIAVPAWHVDGKLNRLPLLDNLKELGYNHVSFVHAGDEDLIYHREGQIVGRELVTLIRN